ncbi:alpha/beta hydrolase [Lysinibacillus xylanilyticus]|uniref:alpha/beta hydrolase n=1 Tax=Lysinibacillus xylanilyticus TaxID=582475 RepID=UPI002B24762B|nr:alpha/beta hydrolase [Lysinibacillus xylanilyticus]MEB2302353.1 alpha/beta hydrolase [Lysinibacillus xylanilyticus]
MKRKYKVIITIVSLLLVLFVGAGFFAGNYFYNLALNPNTDKSAVLDAPINSIAVNPKEAKEKEESEKWFKETSQDSYVQSFDDLKLHAYTLKNTNETNKWAIVFHGYSSDGSQMAKYAKHFYDTGYNVLIPDARAHGKSEGDYIGMGWHDRLDVVSWINNVTHSDKNSEIILYGISMGGATVMMASGEDLPNNVKAIIEDCGYSSVWDEFSYQLQEIFHLPAFPIMHFSSIVTKVRADYTLGEANTVEQVAKSKTPMLFIHGSNDTFVPSYMLNEVYEAANVPKEKMIVEGAGHGGAESIAGDSYWKTINNFLAKYVE